MPHRSPRSRNPGGGPRSGPSAASSMFPSLRARCSAEYLARTRAARDRSASPGAPGRAAPPRCRRRAPDTIGASEHQQRVAKPPLASAVTRRAMFRIEAGLGRVAPPHWAAIADELADSPGVMQPGRRGHPPADLRHGRGQLGRLGIVVAGDPEPGQRARRAQRRRLASPAAMTFPERGGEVVVLRGSRFSHTAVARAAARGAPAPPGPGTTWRGRAGRPPLARPGQLLGPVGPYRLQQPVAPAPSAPNRHQRLVHQGAEEVQHVPAASRPGAHASPRCQRAATGEYREPPQQRPLGRREQL